MQQLISFWKKPYAEKGLIVGTLDTLLKAFTIVLWGYITYVLILLLLDSLLTDYNPLNKMWWFSYCFSIFFGSSWLAYIILFVRDYNEE